jgi:hypothetical protein
MRLTTGVTNVKKVTDVGSSLGLSILQGGYKAL